MTTSARLLIGLGLLAAVLAHPGPVSAQDRSFEDAATGARQRTLADRIPFAGLDQRHARRGSWSVNSFYVVTEPASYEGARRTPGALHYVVVREIGGPATPSTVQWADSRLCPGVSRMLLAMERLPAVRPDVPGLGREGELSLTMDGVAHTFWNRTARSGRNDAAVGLEISGNVDSPIAAWWRTAEDGLKDCWSSLPLEGLSELR